ncbi:hypothetical protein KCP78_15270 [Salmonella enterica subsp. enterica]|nr:hypothetical protein KCP78_15270 [Salmonella enterica subsp. enterica]
MPFCLLLNTSTALLAKRQLMHSHSSTAKQQRTPVCLRRIRIAYRQVLTASARSHPPAGRPFRRQAAGKRRHHPSMGKILGENAQFANGKGHRAIRLQTGSFHRRYVARPDLVRRGRLMQFNIHGVIVKSSSIVLKQRKIGGDALLRLRNERSCIERWPFHKRRLNSERRAPC